MALPGFKTELQDFPRENGTLPFPQSEMGCTLFESLRFSLRENQTLSGVFDLSHMCKRKHNMLNSDGH